MKRYCLFFLLLLTGATFPLSARAQQAAPQNPQPRQEDPIDAERPGFTNGTGTVPPGHVQFEAGYVATESLGSTEHRLFDSALLRVPTGANTEVRLGLPTYFFTHTALSYALNGSGGGPENTRGFGDMSLSAKWRFLDAPAPRTRPSLALIAQTTVPTGEPAYRETHWQPSLALESSYDFSASWNVQADVVYARLADSGQPFTQYSGAVNLSHNLTDTTGLFLETYRIAPTGKDAYNGNYLDFGITHVIANNTQLDINAGTGITNAARYDHFFGVGVARRW